MAVHGVFISPKSRDATAVDLTLRSVFADVYRIGAEFWLIDCLLDAEDVARSVRTRLPWNDRIFVAALGRDVWSGLSTHARAWLTAPARSWGVRDDGRGVADVRPGLVPAEAAGGTLAAAA